MRCGESCCLLPLVRSLLKVSLKVNGLFHVLSFIWLVSWEYCLFVCTRNHRRYNNRNSVTFYFLWQWFYQKLSISTLNGKLLVLSMGVLWLSSYVIVWDDVYEEHRRWRLYQCRTWPSSHRLRLCMFISLLYMTMYVHKSIIYDYVCS